MGYNFKSRDEIDQKYKWNLEKVFSSDEELQKKIEEIESLTEKFKTYKGRVSESADTILEILNLYETIGINFGLVSTYISNRFNEDNRDAKYQALSDKLSSLYTNYSAASAYFIPEILSSDIKKLQSFIDQKEELKIYGRWLENILRYKPHTLSESEEGIIASLSPVLSAGQKSFSMLTVADMKFPMVNVDGKDVQLTSGNFVPLLTEANVDDRKEVFEAYYKTYQDHINTLASTLDANTKSIAIEAKLRKYNSAREAALFANKIPVSVYDQLLDTVGKNITELHDYVDVRKKVLGLEKIHMYDVYKNLVEDMDINYTFEEAKEMILDALKPLGEKYVNDLRNGFESRWCDVYETPGKRGGAYSSGSYKTDPYILLNYHGTLDDVFTVAHEMGHSMHSLYSRGNQPYVYSGYSIFVAEVASTMNESLLTFYLLDKWKDDPKKKMYILNHFMDSIKGTLFRQTQFAEYEKEIYEAYESGVALTPDFLSKKYEEINKKYYGPTMEDDDYIKYEWARIPHFYYDFYVYQYATGISAALSFAKRVLNGGEKERDMYLQFLQSGSSLDPIDVLKRAGVDMNSPQPIQDAIDLFKEFKDEFKKLI